MNQSPIFEAGYRWLLCLHCKKPHIIHFRGLDDAPIIDCECGYRSLFARGCVALLDRPGVNPNNPTSYEQLSEEFGYLEEVR